MKNKAFMSVLVALILLCIASPAFAGSNTLTTFEPLSQKFNISGAEQLTITKVDAKIDSVTITQQQADSFKSARIILISANKKIDYISSEVITSAGTYNTPGKMGSDRIKEAYLLIQEKKAPAPVDLVFVDTPITVLKNQYFRATVHAVDENQMCVSGYTDSIKIWVDGVPFGNATLEMKDGEASDKGFIFDKAGTYTIDATGSNGLSASHTIRVLEHGEVSKVVITYLKHQANNPNGTDTIIPHAFARITVNLYDEYGNLCSNVNGGRISLSDSNGALSPDGNNTIDVRGGSATDAGIFFTKPGKTILKATYNNIEGFYEVDIEENGPTSIVFNQIWQRPNWTPGTLLVHKETYVEVKALDKLGNIWGGKIEVMIDVVDDKGISIVDNSKGVLFNQTFDLKNTGNTNFAIFAAGDYTLVFWQKGNTAVTGSTNLFTFSNAE